MLLSGPGARLRPRRARASRRPVCSRAAGAYEGVARLYAALDAYVVPSRQEGGPKSVLEAMASGVPIVSTRTGQATELILDGKNGRLVEVEDAEALADALADDRLSGLIAAGRETALANDKHAQEPLWRSFFDGFVAHA